MSEVHQAITRRDAVGGILVGTLSTGMALLGQSLRAEDTRLAAATKTKSDSHPLNPALRMAHESLDAMKQVNDFTATFYKDEVVANKRINQQMLIKLRENPFSVYLRFVKPYEGREVIYVAGKNEDKLLVHGSGIEKIAGTIKLDPTSKRAMDENRYPITMIGLTNLVKKIITQWEGELGLADVDVKHFPNAKIGNVECRVYQASHAKPREGVKFHMTRLYVNKTTTIPVRVEQLDFPAKAGEQPAILEQYTYLDVKSNSGLGDKDFDPRNEAYDF